MFQRIMVIIEKEIKMIIQRMGFLFSEKFIKLNLWHKYNEILGFELYRLLKSLVFNPASIANVKEAISKVPLLFPSKARKKSINTRKTIT